MMRLILLLLTLPAGAVPLRWTTTFEKTGHCQYSVPPQWRGASDAHAVPLMYAPGGAATVEQTWSSVSGWSVYAGHMRQVFKPAVVHEDTPHRLWLEYPADWPGVHYYVAVPSAGGACVAMVDLRPQPNAELREVLREVIDTMRAVY